MKVYLILIILGSLFLPTPVAADTLPITAVITSTPPTLSAVPQLTFPNQSVKAIINTRTTLTQATPTQLEVDDFSTLTTHWQLAVTMSTPRQVETQRPLPGTRLHLVATRLAQPVGHTSLDQRIDSTPDFVATTLATEQSQIIWQATTASPGKGKNQLIFQEAQLLLPRYAHVQAGAYQATLTWSLAILPTD